MIGKGNPQQFEIFRSVNEVLKPEKKRRPFLDCIWNHEKIILTVIAFLVVSVVSFSLGFEKGKRTISKVVDKNNQAQTKKKTLPAKKEVVEDVKERKLKISSTTRLASSSSISETKKSKDNYTVQVATYKSKGFAQKEAQRLKSKGFQPSVVSRGDFTVICVGKFLNKNQAKKSMSELRKRYQDCFIRRL